MGQSFLVGRDGTRAECVDLFAKLLAGLVPITTKVTPAEAYRKQFLSDWRELQDKNFACWCPLDGPCHADALRDAVIIMETSSDA